MEDAAKALTMAGSVLISIMIITALLFGFQQWGILPKTQDKNKEISQALEINKEFESYNKQNIYGAEVITVINKAIANNEKYGITAETNDPYYIDVQIIIKNDVYGYTEKYTREKDGTISGGKTSDTTNTPTFKAGNTYTLKKDYLTLYNLCVNKPIKRTEKRTGNVYEVTAVYPAEEEFRLKYFTCKGMQTREDNGRIYKIVFEEIKNDDLEDVRDKGVLD